MLFPSRTAHNSLKIRSLLKLFQSLDREIQKFQSKSGLNCLAGCGRCCENPNVETTVLELLPLAQKLWQEGSAEDWLKKIESVQEKGPCVFYKPDPLIPGNGRCSVYSLRPLICRLFGFSAKIDKHKDNVFVTCATIKKLYMKEFESAQHKVQSGSLPIASMEHYSMKAYQIDPTLGRDQLPINRAIKIVLEKTGLHLRYLSRISS